MIHERTNDMFCEVAIGKSKKKIYQLDHKPKPNDLVGGIYKVTHNFGQKYRHHQDKTKFEGLKYEDIVERHATISGEWLGDVLVNGKI